MKSHTLWTKNFTIITLGTVISAIGGVAMSFALGFVVFDATGSTLLSALFTAVSTLPQIVLPILVSPCLDNFRRRPVIFGLDYLSGVIYLLFGWYLLSHEFHLPLYLLFSFLASSIGSVYSLAYGSLYPNLIPEGFAQKGYAISGMIYPTVIMVMTPAASILYTRWGLAPICLGEGVLLLLAATLETRIRVEERTRAGEGFRLQAWVRDFREGFAYLKREKGLLRIYSYMPITQGISEGTDPLIRAWFRTTPGMDITMYALFTTAQFIGRTIGGLVHYKWEIPPQRRFSFAYMVYIAYHLMDAALLWLGFPLMLVNRGVRLSGRQQRHHAGEQRAELPPRPHAGQGQRRLQRPLCPLLRPVHRGHGGPGGGAGLPSVRGPGQPVRGGPLPPHHVAGPGGREEGL